jgi:excisionase family DNA binding protein
MSIPSIGVGDDDRLAVSPGEACRLLSIGTTCLYDLLKRNELESFAIGRARRVTLASIHNYITRRLVAERPAP